MSTVNGLNAYTNSLHLYGLYSSNDDSDKSTENNARQRSLQGSSTRSSNSTSILSRLTGSSGEQTLTEQLSGLVRLTRYAMDSMGLGSDSRVTFSRLREYCDQVQESFSSSVTEGLESARPDLGTATFRMDPDGKIAVHSPSQLTEALTELGLSHAAGDVAELKRQLVAAGVDFSGGFNFTLNGDGTVTALGTSARWQSAIDAGGISVGSLVYALAGQGIDPTIAFTLRSNEDMSVSVNTGSTEYRKALQAFFNENPDIVRNYQRQEALSEIENARKFLSLSPSEMRTRLQLESLASWWDTQDSNSLSFGTYSGGIFSRLSGINVSV